MNNPPPRVLQTLKTNKQKIKPKGLSITISLCQKETNFNFSLCFPAMTGDRVRKLLSFLIYSACSRNLRLQLITEKQKQKLSSWNVNRSLILFSLPCGFHLMFSGTHSPFPAANTPHSLGSHTQLLVLGLNSSLSSVSPTLFFGSYQAWSHFGFITQNYIQLCLL